LTVSIAAAQQAPPAGPVTYKPIHALTDPLQQCPGNVDAFHPEKDGVYAVEGGIKAPKVKHSVPAGWSAEARTRSAFNRFSASSTVSFVVDTNGTPQDVCIVYPAGYGLDEEVAKAVHQYHYEPAKKDGVPVAVRISLTVPFVKNF
jgi:TonB family protein